MTTQEPVPLLTAQHAEKLSIWIRNGQTVATIDELSELFVALRAIAEGRSTVQPAAAQGAWRTSDGQDLSRALVDLLRHHGLKPTAALAVIDDLNHACWALVETHPGRDAPPAPTTKETPP